MTRKNAGLIVGFLNFIIFGISIICQTSGFVDISIKNATPVILVPLITAYSVNSSVGLCSIVGFLTGACMDSLTKGAYCFNTITFICLATGVCLATNNLFNKNLKGVAALSAITAVIYHLSYFVVFHLLKYPIADSLGFLVRYVFPSALYSAVFIFPFYYLYKYLNKLKEV